MTDPSAIDKLLAQARSNLDRVRSRTSPMKSPKGRSSSTSDHSSSAGAMESCPAPS